jgi:hypothetical protein
MRNDHSIWLSSGFIHNDDIREVSLLGSINKFVDSMVSTIDRLGIWNTHFDFSVVEGKQEEEEGMRKEKDENHSLCKLFESTAGVS